MTLQPPIGDPEGRAAVRPPVLARALPAIGRETAVAVALALLIIAYGNLLSLRPEGIGTALDWALTLGSLTFLGLLRQRTGNLAGCVVFHWLVVTAMWGTLFLMSR